MFKHLCTLFAQLLDIDASLGGVKMGEFLGIFRWIFDMGKFSRVAFHWVFLVPGLQTIALLGEYS